MKAVGILYRVVVLGALYTVLTEGKDCTFRGETYKPGQKIIGPACRSKMTCQSNGVFWTIGDYKYRCPGNSTCRSVDDECQCDFGFNGTKDENGFLIQCTPADSCKYGRSRVFQHKQQWLNNQCTTRYRCNDGKTETYKHECPEYSYCMYGECRCETTPDRWTNEFGLVTSCPAPTCKYAGKTYKMGEYFMNRGCTARKGCFRYGIRENVLKVCPYYSKCIVNECVCNDGYVAESRDSKGFINQCIESSCEFNGAKLKDGEVLLESNCNIFVKCAGGKLKVESFSCPANSHCDAKSCQCNQGLSVSARNQDGLITKCS